MFINKGNYDFKKIKLKQTFDLKVDEVEEKLH